MSVGPVTGNYANAEDSLNLARAWINDMTRNTAGLILSDTAPFTVIYLNAAIRKTQRYLANNGIETNRRDNVILTPLPPTPLNDPSVQVSVGFDGYNDGASSHATPTLPADLIVPYELWERQTGSAGQFVPMEQPQEGLQSLLPGSYFNQWEWRENRIFMRGSTITEDLRIRYEASIATLKANAQGNFQGVIIPIVDSTEAIAAGIVEQYAFGRGSAMRQEAKARWQEEADEIVNRFVRRDQRVAYRARRFAAGTRINGALSGSFK